MTTLAHRLRLVDYFALAFGVMVGTAWLVVMDDILRRGGTMGARLGKTTTFTFLTLVIIFALAGAGHGSVANFHPLFSHAPLISIFLVWQIVPWLLSGFESVGKYSEEASSDFKTSGFSVAIGLTIF